MHKCGQAGSNSGASSSGCSRHPLVAKTRKTFASTIEITLGSMDSVRICGLLVMIQTQQARSAYSAASAAERCSSVIRVVKVKTRRTKQAFAKNLLPLRLAYVLQLRQIGSGGGRLHAGASTPPSFDLWHRDVRPWS